MPVRLLGIAWTVAALLASAAPPAAAPLPERYQDAHRRVNEYVQAHRTDAAVAMTDSLLTDARERGDVLSQGILLRTKGEILSRYGMNREAAPVLREAVQWAQAARDTVTALRATFWLVSALSEQEDAREADVWNDAMLDLAIAARDTLYEGQARLRQAFAALSRGSHEEALRRYVHVVRLLERAGDPHALGNAHIGLGRTYSALGEYDAARHATLRALDLGRNAGNQWIEAHASNNLGALAATVGDPSESIECYRHAIELFRVFNMHGSVINSLKNVAIAQKHLGQLDDAMSTLEEARELCRAHGVSEAGVELHVANLLALRQRPHEAERTYRRVLDGSTTPAQKVDAILGLAELLGALGRAGEALALVEERGLPLAARLEVVRRVKLSTARAGLLLAVGRAEEGLWQALAADREARRASLSSLRLETLPLVARCQAALGRQAGSRRTLEAAVAQWETERGLPADPEWRIERGLSGRLIFTRLACALLDESVGHVGGVRRAFDALQSYKARTLQERMQGPLPHRTEPPFLPATLEMVQDSLLAEGELFLDAYVGPEESLVFVVSRNDARVVRLPGADSLATRCRWLRNVLASPPTLDTATRRESIEAAAGAFATMMFAGAEDMVLGARRVMISPDGALNLLPLSLLLPRGDAPVALERVPSATLLRELRQRAAASGSPPSILAMAGERNDAGKTLSGAAAEVRWLERAFEPVELRAPNAEGAPIVSDLGHFTVLHLAAHTWIDDQHPWRSGVVLGRSDGSPVLLRASRISESRFSGQLAVLSGCESAGGRVVAGEGVQGLSAAFLAAGVPAVVATLWPVDDDVTTRFMRAFYSRLGQGSSVALALAAAQSNLRAHARTADPFYWAGFVLVGDGGVHVPLRVKSSVPAIWVLLIGLAAMVVLVSAARRKSGSGVIPAPPSRPTP